MLLRFPPSDCHAFEQSEWAAILDFRPDAILTGLLLSFPVVLLNGCFLLEFC
jgi:hypothetical protein